MRTLFIHPSDESTAFLSTVYNNYTNDPNVTILNGTSVPHNLIVNALRSHDRIVFLGHGTPFGLLDMIGDRFVITPSDVQFFRNKPVVCVWCNANIFVDRYDLNAFATGMFVSETYEASCYDLPEDQELIDASNNLMASILNTCIFEDVETIRETVEREYYDPNNPIIGFNRECMGFEV